MRLFFIDAQGIGVMDDVTRIEWRYLETGAASPLLLAAGWVVLWVAVVVWAVIAR